MKVLNTIIAAAATFAASSFVQAASLGYDFDHSGAATAFYINAFDYSTSLSDITTNYWSAYTYADGVSVFSTVDTYSDASTNIDHYGLGSLSAANGTYLSLMLTNDSSYSYTNFKYNVLSTSSVPLALEYAFVSNTDLTASTYTVASLAWASAASSITLNSGYSVLFRWTDLDGSAYTIDKAYIAATQVPEPSTYALLLGVGTLALVGYRRFRRK